MQGTLFADLTVWRAGLRSLCRILVSRAESHLGETELEERIHNTPGYTTGGIPRLSPFQQPIRPPVSRLVQMLLNQESSGIFSFLDEYQLQAAISTLAAHPDIRQRFSDGAYFVGLSNRKFNPRLDLLSALKVCGYRLPLTQSHVPPRTLVRVKESKALFIRQLDLEESTSTLSVSEGELWTTDVAIGGPHEKQPQHRSVAIICMDSTMDLSKERLSARLNWAGYEVRFFKADMPQNGMFSASLYSTPKVDGRDFDGIVVIEGVSHSFNSEKLSVLLFPYAMLLKSMPNKYFLYRRQNSQFIAKKDVGGLTPLDLTQYSIADVANRIIGDLGGFVVA